MLTAVTPNQYDPQLAQYANEVVNQVFYGTLMREFRNAQPPGMFDQGPGGQAFIRQLDMELVRRMNQGGNSPLAEVLLKQLSPRQVHQIDSMNQKSSGLAGMERFTENSVSGDKGINNG
ncbi:MAG: hypothetical protein GY869_03985 [Planctomycetes bacterium]|nr:hypothetical protein [Planctomycetota bacterium]